MTESNLKEDRPDVEEALPGENILNHSLNETGRQTSGNLPIHVDPEAKRIIPNMSE
jgi:hypothetical protein